MQTTRGDAAAADTPRRRFAATPRLLRGNSIETATPRRYELGSGAFATVLRANKRKPAAEAPKRRRSSIARRTSLYEPPDPDDRAIKVTQLGRTEERRNRMLAQLALEVKTLRRVSGHPNVVSLYDCARPRPKTEFSARRSPRTGRGDAVAATRIFRGDA